MHTIMKHTKTNAHSGLKQTNNLDGKIFLVFSSKVKLDFGLATHLVAAITYPTCGL